MGSVIIGRRLPGVLLILAFVLAVCTPAAAQEYTVTDLGVLGPALFSTASAVNTSGAVAGWSGRQAFRWDKAGGMVGLGYLEGADLSEASGINDAGQVVGASGLRFLGPPYPFAFRTRSNQAIDPVADVLMPFQGGNGSRAFAINRAGTAAGSSQLWIVVNRFPDEISSQAVVWDAQGTPTGLPFLPGGAFSDATAINTQGDVAGESDAFDGADHAVLWKNGKMADLGFLPHTNNSKASGINDSGQIVGDSWFTASFEEIGGGPPVSLVQYVRGFMRNPNAPMTDIGDLGGDLLNTRAEGINSNGRVVGTSFVLGDPGRAIVWQNGKIFDLNMLIPRHSGWVLEEATAINDRGRIVGFGTVQSANNAIHAFLLTPPLLYLLHKVGFQLSGAAYNPGAAVWEEQITITNVSADYIAGPLQVPLAGLSNSVSLANATGVAQGKPFLTIDVPALAPSGSASVVLQFHAPDASSIHFDANIFAGEGMGG